MWISKNAYCEWRRRENKGRAVEQALARGRGQSRPPLQLQVKLAFVHHHLARIPDGINELSRRSPQSVDGGGINSGSLNKTTVSRARSVISRLLDGLAH